MEYLFEQSCWVFVPFPEIIFSHATEKEFFEYPPPRKEKSVKEHSESQTREEWKLWVSWQGNSIFHIMDWRERKNVQKIKNTEEFLLW